jgi:beta-glucosidase-like glycosyl hydrolase
MKSNSKPACDPTKPTKTPTPRLSTQTTASLSTSTAGISMNMDTDRDRNTNAPQSQSQFPTIAQLTLDEKLSLLSGKSLWLLADIPRLNVPSITVSDGPHGVRKPIKELSFEESAPATCFPTAAALACSWDVELLKKVGQTLRQECVSPSQTCQTQ